MKSKKLLAELMALTFVLGGAALPQSKAVIDTAITASAESVKFGDYYYRLLGDGTVEIMHYYGSDTEVTIPSEIDGKAVTVICGGAFSYSNLTSVKIPDSVTNIGNEAFCGCESLIDITIPDSVTNIGCFAFIGTKWLENKMKIHWLS